MTLKIIAISGSGRSGSTLLSLLLSQSPTTFNLGQTRHLAQAWQKNVLCSCGRGLQECSVYRPIIEDVFGQSSTSLADFKTGLARLSRAASAVRDWGSRANLDALRTDHASTVAALRGLIEKVAEETGAEVLVDSSKTPEFAVALELAFPGDVTVLNLTRDPRAVAESWHRKSPNWLSTLKSIRTYGARQRRLENWSESLGSRFVGIRYEDLASTPGAELEMVAKASGLLLPETLFVAADRVHLDWRMQHLYPPANERVLAERAEDVLIRESSGWRSNQNQAIQMLVRIFGWRDLRKYLVESSRDLT